MYLDLDADLVDVHRDAVHNLLDESILGPNDTAKFTMNTVSQCERA